MQLLPFDGPDEFVDFAKALEVAIDKQMQSGVFTQLFYNQVLVTQRLIGHYLPFLHHRKFFGQAPYDMVLSLLPPVRPHGRFALLADNPIFAGSFTGAVPSCIFVVGPRQTTLNFWLHASHKSNLASLTSLLEAHGVTASMWEK